MKKVKLGQIADEIKSSNKKPSIGTPIVGLEHLDPGSLDLKRWGTATNSTFSKTFKKGDVLFGRRRAYLKKAAIAPFDGICSGDITVIRANSKNIIPSLLPFFIQNQRFFDYAVKHSDGSLSPRAKWSSLKEYEIALPETLNEQQKLVDILQSLEDSKQSYQNVLSILDEVIKSRFVDLISEANGATPLTKVVDVLYGFPFDSSKFNNCGKGVPLIRIRDVNTGLSGTYTTEIVSPKYIVKEGDCVAGMDGNFDTVKWTHQDAYLNQRCCKFTPTGVNKEFMLYFLQNRLCEIEENAQSTTVKHLSAKDINKIKIPNVAIDLQKKFSEEALLIDKLKFKRQISNRFQRSCRPFRKLLGLLSCI
jgi:type I restriction enzyme S subunit